jgi:hypothetical protein
MRWILITALLVPAFPAHAETKATFTDLAFYTSDPQSAAGLFSAVGGLLSATVALIAVIVSIRIANRAKKTSESANQTAISALEAAKDNTKTLFRIERPYITGGGDWDTTLTNVRTGATGREFVVEVKNNGKTPALLTHFFVEFALKAQLPVTPIYTNKHVHYDWIGANETKNEIKRIDISDVNGQPADVIHGEFHYRDFDHGKHYFRFILSIGPKTTHPDIALDKPAYAHWN